MAIKRDSLTMKLAAAVLAFAAVFFAVRALDGSSANLSGRPDVAVREGELPSATTAQRIEGLQAQVREAPSDPDGYSQLGLAYLQRVRETGDPTFYPRAQGSFEQALRLHTGRPVPPMPRQPATSHPMPSRPTTSCGGYGRPSSGCMPTASRTGR